MDYKLSEYLHDKMGRLWQKKYKDLTKDRSNYNVYQQQAGAIITKWVRKNRSTFFRSDPKGKSDGGATNKFKNLVEKEIMEKKKKLELNKREKKPVEIVADEYMWTQVEGRKKWKKWFKNNARRRAKTIALQRMSTSNLNSLQPKERTLSPEIIIKPVDSSQSQRITLLRPNPDNEFPVAEPFQGEQISYSPSNEDIQKQQSLVEDSGRVANPREIQAQPSMLSNLSIPQDTINENEEEHLSVHSGDEQNKDDLPEIQKSD